MNPPQSRRASRLLRMLLGFALLAACATAAHADLRVGNFFSPELNVLRFSATGNFVGTFVPTNSGGLTFPLGGSFGPDGNFCVSDSDHGHVLRYNGKTGAFIDVFVPAGSGGRGGPTFLVFHDFAPGTAVPVPSTILLVVAALVMCAIFLRRRRTSAPRARGRETDAHTDAPSNESSARASRLPVPEAEERGLA